MLYHHDSRDYDVAASSSAKRAREKLEGMFSRGKDRATALVQHVTDSIPTDRIVNTKAMEFGYADGIRLGFGGEDFSLHRHARGHVIDKTNVLTRKVADAMIEQGEWGERLLVENLNRIYHENARERMLVREVGGEVRALLSDRYRRIDSAPIIQAFASACGKMRAIPIESHATDTKWMLKAMLPHVFEPVDNEVLGFGISLKNSDYGDGAMEVRAFILRLWCTNYAMRNECLRQVHLGRRLDENIRFSETTYKLDTDASASAIRDIVGDVLSPDSVHTDLHIIGQAHEEQIDASVAIEALRTRSRISKSEARELVEVFNKPDVELLPPGNTAWRLSNALSLFAQSQDDDRRMDFENLAGEVLNDLVVN